MRITALLVIFVSSGLSNALSQESHPPQVLDAQAAFVAEGMLSACHSLAKEDYGDLRRLVESGLDVNERGNGGCTLLLWCWCNGYHHAFEALLEMGADAHAVVDADLEIDIDGNRIHFGPGESVAWISIRHCQLRKRFVDKVMRYLHNANQRDASGGTLFHALFASADDKVISRPAIAQERTPTDSPYNILMAMDRPKIVDSEIFGMLYFAGVDIDARDNEGLSAIEKYLRWMQSVDANMIRVESAVSVATGLVATTGYFDDAHNRSALIAELETLAKAPKLSAIIERCIRLVNSYPRHTKKPFDIQAHFGDDGSYVVSDMHSDISAAEVLQAIMPVGIHRFKNQRTFETLQAEGFDPNVRGKSGFTHLFAAYLVNKESEFRALLEMGADPDLSLDGDLWPSVPSVIQGVSNATYCPERGDTVLLAAAFDPKRIEFLRMAMEFTKSIDLRDSLNRNILHRLLYQRIVSDRGQLVEEMVTKGVDINAQSIGGATPCHEAVYRNALAIPELVRRGAKTDVRDLQGRTIIDLLRLSVKEKWTFHEESKQVLNTLGIAEINKNK